MILASGMICSFHRASSAFSQPHIALATITVDYPETGSIFPPDIAAPTFTWHDESGNVTEWTIDVTFTDGSPSMHFKSAGPAPRIGEIDPRCVSPNNEVPGLTPRQATAHTWAPAAEDWERIKRRSKGRSATVTIEGIAPRSSDAAVSLGATVIETSKDPVKAPIFYRDVPLIPSKGERGLIQPLAKKDLPLLAWRLRDISQSSSRLLLTGMHTCANCHSFSLDGKTFGMDIDGPANDKGLYALAPIKQQMSLRNQDVISWSSIKDNTASPSRIGFMSQVSPDGRYVITMLRDLRAQLGNSYYLVNFQDYRFLQVFYPTRGILAWYDRVTGKKHVLPGADDERFVHTNAVWSPDGKSIVFARAEARAPEMPGQKAPQRANDPEETQIQYDLYRIPFNEGRGGVPVPIEGASNNGMSNSFPKVSPDGRWIVYVESRNAELMRPDSQLYIVPFEGGVARRLRCNRLPMNSWHSFSPNGHWLVFSSKSHSPYTQMFLTHIDDEGNSSPAIAIDNATAANRAVNIPEFVNIPSDGLLRIDVPAAESYRHLDIASELAGEGKLDEAIAEWRKVLELDARNAAAHNSLGAALTVQGRITEGLKHLREAREIDPTSPDPAELEITFQLQSYYRQKFSEAMRTSDCKSTMDYGGKLLITGQDSEVETAMNKCAAEQPQVQP
ncbi:MAG TPA: tetratricopeptide repeat protein [Terracidiphilus sp.]|nr:tetratricopeptide repeat protein [Terracidiphilus sp.]